MLSYVEDTVLLVAEPLGGILFAKLLYYGDGRLKQGELSATSNAYGCGCCSRELN